MHVVSVAIIGVGLLGGSLGLALKTRGLAGVVRGVGRRRESLSKALDTGAIDSAHLDLSGAVQDADIIIVCTPASQVIPMLDLLRNAALPSAVVTDVASTKASICAHADATWPAPRRFVGSHPMAGSEKFGPEHAYANLYEGAVVVLEKSGGLDVRARETIREMWQCVGARIVEVEPVEHDAIVARTSHVPHVAATVLAMIAARQGANARPLSGKGFRDATRIASSRSEVWRDVCLTNREAVLNGLDEFTDELRQIRAAIDRSDAAAIEAFFNTGRIAREEVAGT
ncbi:MAG: prephenate dehydrogenase/arogenate dehydrogenase family protein [Candidatus Hydrogenedentes bacterium]|nr:prephenate dehydrogenase/arogenate dehydrogenase family protein [Candidatus Hydrogenedentota bacterium]